MKKYTILGLIMLGLFTFSCELEDEVPCEPTCGEVVRRGFGSSVADHWELIVKNECTGRTKAFRVNEQQYYTFDKGDNVCSVDGTSWKQVPTKSK